MAQVVRLASYNRLKHAEQKLVQYALDKGYYIISIGAGRPICADGLHSGHQGRGKVTAISDILPMKVQTNHDILVQLFWEHVQFGWASQTHLRNRAVGFRAYRNLVSELTKKSIGMMSDLQEGSRVQVLLHERYGIDLVPTETDLGFPSDQAVGDADSWQPAFNRLRELYGKEIGVARRTGKDLRKYKERERLLRQSLKFSAQDAYRFINGGRQELIVSFQEFPREHLYRVESKEVVILEFDDWPVSWFREWGPGVVRNE
jgi:hypothetical protein